MQNININITIPPKAPRKLDEEIMQLNKQFIDFPVHVTTWNGYGIVRGVKDEDTFIVVNKHGELCEVDKFYLRSLTELQINSYFLPAFEGYFQLRALEKNVFASV